jgi:hypothetical protein
MDRHLDNTLRAIGNDYADKISRNSRFYAEVDIGKKGQLLGYRDIEERYNKVLAVVPLKKAARGMKVRIDGRTFVNYGQLSSGVVIPGHVIKRSSLSHKPYRANDNMILNFT